MQSESTAALKTCLLCGLSKPLTDFYPNPRRIQGCGSRCRSCLSATTPRGICGDCGLPSSRPGRRCKSCSLKQQWQNPVTRARRETGWQAYNQRRRKARPCCSVCGVQLTSVAAIGLCHSCNGKRMAVTNPYFRGELISNPRGPNEATRVAFRAWYREHYPSPDSLSDEQEQVLIGGLMGDGCLIGRRTAGAWPYYSETHCDAQHDYLLWKAEVLKPFRPRLAQAKPRTGRPGAWQMTTGHQPSFADYRHAFYPDGIKVVPQIAFERLKPQGIAVWMMDDGSVNHQGRFSVLCTDPWPLHVQEQLCAWFSERWGLHPVPQLHKKAGSFSKQLRSVYRLRFHVDDTTALIRLIQPFVHPLFQEKWRLSDTTRWWPAMTRQESAAVMNAKRSALIKAGVFTVGYHTGTIRVTADQPQL